MLTRCMIVSAGVAVVAVSGVSQSHAQKPIYETEIRATAKIAGEGTGMMMYDVAYPAKEDSANKEVVFSVDPFYVDMAFAPKIFLIDNGAVDLAGTELDWKQLQSFDAELVVKIDPALLPLKDDTQVDIEFYATWSNAPAANAIRFRTTAKAKTWLFAGFDTDFLAIDASAFPLPPVRMVGLSAMQPAYSALNGSETVLRATNGAASIDPVLGVAACVADYRLESSYSATFAPNAQQHNISPAQVK